MGHFIRRESDGLFPPDLAGPVSSLPAVIALAGMFKKRVLVVFLSVSLSVSILLGWLYQLFG